jgi:hypothetical protein
MFGWFKSKARKEAEIEAAVAEALRIRDERAAYEKLLEEQRLNELKEAARLAEEERAANVKNSDKPWFCNEVIDVDGNGRVALRTDWNDAWVSYLRDTCKFEGDEERIVMQWLLGFATSANDHSKNGALDLFHTPGYEDEDVTVPNKKLN